MPYLKEITVQINNIIIKKVFWYSKEYLATVELRERLLRIPLGLRFAKQEIEQEHNELHIAAFDGRTLLGCVVLSPFGQSIMKMRQLIVDEPFQGKGIGTKLVRFTEDLAVRQRAVSLFAHARKTAVPFYQKLGYSVVGDEFIEVTIPHFKIEKQLG